jgi:acetyl esterase/lipase
MQRTRRRTNEGAPGSVLTAGLKLRFAGRRLNGRVYWAAAHPGVSASPLFFVPTLGEDEDSESLCRVLCSAAGAVVLAVPLPAAVDHDDELAALEWAAEHADQLGAHDEQLIVAGQGAGGAHAACLSARARDNGWPQLRRQVVMYPSFTHACPMPSLLTGVAPATVISSDTRIDDGSRYAALLRAAKVEVNELRYSPAVLPGHDDFSAAMDGRTR